MNGADAIIATARNAGVEVCFANPGTTEVHLVGALDHTPEIRPVLGLFEGVCTGAADGYARMANKPALTLLHLGPGLANGSANLHNAEQARTPVINLVGTNATRHLNNDSLMSCDIRGLAGIVSGFVRESRTSVEGARDFTDAHAHSVQMRDVATLVVPADVQWEDAPEPPEHLPPRAPTFDTSRLDGAARSLKNGPSAALIVDGPGLLGSGLRALVRIRETTGCRIFSKRQPARIDTAPGLYPIERLGYFPEHFTAQVKGVSEFVLVGTRQPAAIFAYRDGPTHVIPEGSSVRVLADVHDDIVSALEALAEVLGAPESVGVGGGQRPELPVGQLSSANLGQALAHLIPDEAIVVDESITSAPNFYEEATGRVRMSYLSLTGGAIGIAGPLATGAAVGSPDRPVVVIQGDGSAMYTLQALWTQARERLNVTTVICANHRYEILDVEHRRAGVNVTTGPIAAMMDLTKPTLDWLQLAAGMGVPAVRVSTGEGLAHQLHRAVNQVGPHLIELVMD